MDFKNAQGDCFQILGFDIFLDSNLKAWLFEINDHPSLNINLEKEGQKGLIKEVSEIDKYIKTKILGEAIGLMKKKSIKRSEIEQYKGYIRILPDEGYDLYNAFSQLKGIYNKLQGTSKAKLSMNKFANLSKVPGMTGEKLMKASYEIMFKRI